MDYISHPPLSDEDLAAIAAKHTSPAAVALLREVERLRILERTALGLARVLRAGRWDPYSWEPYVAGIESEHIGRLPGRGKFGLPRPTEKLSTSKSDS